MGWLAAIAACSIVAALLIACLFVTYEWWRRMAWSVPPLSFEMVAVNAVFALLMIVLIVIALISITLILLIAEATYVRCRSMHYRYP